MLFHLVHEVGNRQRWRTKETLSHASAALIADQISGIAGVTGVSANPRTGSVIVTYDTGEARAALAEYLAGLAVNPPIRRAERAAFVSAPRGPVVLELAEVVRRVVPTRAAEAIDIPFCVAGGIRTVEDAGRLLAYGADKISVNSPALADPDLISRLADRFGVQCVVVGIDSRHEEGSDEYRVNQFTGDEKKTRVTQWSTLDWVEEVQKRGAGEIVRNMMNQDGVRRGYDLRQLAAVRSVCRVPLIASGGAGEPVHFLEAFRDAKVDGALAASVFHKKIINIGDLKNYLRGNNIEVRTC